MLDADLAELAVAAYTEPPTISGAVIFRGTHALLREVDGVPVIAFRGTDDPADFVIDALARPELAYSRATGLVFVHAGFKAAAASLFPQVEAAVAGSHNFVLTGHSLGGALALLVGAALRAVGKEPRLIVTFGAPKVGFGRFARALDGIEVRQYRRGNDPVPTLPLALPLFPYRHVRLPLIQVGVEDHNNPFACHRMAGYAADIQGALHA